MPYKALALYPMPHDPQAFRDHYVNIHAVLRGRLQRPEQLVSNPQPDPTPAIESYATSSRDHHDAEPAEISEAEIVEPEGEPANGTPPRIAEMIKAGAFDWKAEE